MHQLFQWRGVGKRLPRVRAPNAESFIAELENDLALQLGDATDALLVAPALALLAIARQEKHVAQGAEIRPVGRRQDAPHVRKAWDFSRAQKLRAQLAIGPLPVGRTLQRSETVVSAHPDRAVFAHCQRAHQLPVGQPQKTPALAVEQQHTFTIRNRKAAVAELKHAEILWVDRHAGQQLLHRGTSLQRHDAGSPEEHPCNRERARTPAQQREGCRGSPRMPSSPCTAAWQQRVSGFEAHGWVAMRTGHRRLQVSCRQQDLRAQRRPAATQVDRAARG